MDEHTDGIILLRQMTLDDVDEHLAGEDSATVKYFSGGVSSVQSVTDWINRSAKENLAGGPKLTFGIVLVQTNKLVGVVDINTNVHDIEFLQNDQGNIAYSVYPNYRKNGYATRAIDLLCKNVNKLMYVKTAVIRTNLDNTPSEQVALSASFTYIGTKMGSECALNWFARELL